MKHNWPGNVRELANRLERAAIMSQNGIIDRDVMVSTGLEDEIGTAVSLKPQKTPAIDFNDENMDDRERVIAALEQSGWVQAKAAVCLYDPEPCLSHFDPGYYHRSKFKNLCTVHEYFALRALSNMNGVNFKDSLKEFGAAMVFICATRLCRLILVKPQDAIAMAAQWLMMKQANKAVQLIVESLLVTLQNPDK
jgi:hypothetical protein